jgi:hypothetical protein
MTMNNSSENEIVEIRNLFLNDKGTAYRAPNEMILNRVYRITG